MKYINAIWKKRKISNKGKKKTEQNKREEKNHSILQG